MDTMEKDLIPFGIIQISEGRFFNLKCLLEIRFHNESHSVHMRPSHSPTMFYEVFTEDEYSRFKEGWSCYLNSLLSDTNNR